MVLSSETNSNLAKLGAYCAVAATALLLFGWVIVPLIFGAPEGSALDMLTSDRSAFEGRRILIQVVFMFFALLALCLSLARSFPATAIVALVFLFFWQILELVPRGLEVFAVGAWAQQLKATVPPDPALLERIDLIHDLAEAMGGIRRYFWMLMNGCLALMFFRSGRNWLNIGLGVFAGIAFVRMALSNVGLAGLLAALPLSGSTLFFLNVTPYFALIAIFLWRDSMAHRGASASMAAPQAVTKGEAV